MSVLICSTKFGGCGYVGLNTDFYHDDTFSCCPSCRDDHCFEVTVQNIGSLTDDENRPEAEKLLAFESSRASAQ